MRANANERADWHALLASAARQQREVLGALLAGHRYSTDADQVRRHLESLEGWDTTREASRPPVN